MKISVTTTTIEANADELKSSRSLSEAFTSLLRNCFINADNSYEPESEEENDNEDDGTDWGNE